MNRTNRMIPPAWMEHLLRSFLPARDRETVAGDLREEFHDRAASQGTARAKLWYLRQALSFAPRGVGVALGKSSVLPLLCAFTGLCGLWLGAMDLRLHHPMNQLAIACSILGQSLTTLAALRLRSAWLRYLSLIGCMGMFSLSAKALVGVLRGYDFEGYILLIALLLAVQSILTILTVPWLQPGSRKSA